MKNELRVLKGIHPGYVLGKKLRERKIVKGRFAMSVNEYPQTITAITRGKRDMNTALALRMEKELGLEEGYFMILQVYHDIEREKKMQEEKIIPDLAKLRPVLFWDTNIETINWIRQYKAIIRRVFERGNKKEKQEMLRFYGTELIEKVLKKPVELK